MADRVWKRGLVLVLAAFAGTAPPSRAGTFELNQVKGLWQFESSLEPVYPASESAITPSGFTIGAAPGPRFASSASPAYGYLNLNSATAPYAGLKPAEALVMPNPAGANGPASASFTNSWTIVMDVRFPALGGYINLLQDRTGNSDDGEIFLNGSGQIQFFGASSAAGPAPVGSGALSANTWYRLAFTSTYDTLSNSQILRAYVNGVITPQTAAGGISVAPDGRYGLAGGVALFSDDNNETAITHVNSLAFWGRALSAADLSTLGAWDANGIDWPAMTPAGGAPPLPPLTGKILFGDFAGSYTPPGGAALRALAAGATATSYAGAVCDVTLDLGAAGGSVPGFPNHHFGSALGVHIMANGDAVYDSAVGIPLTYTQPAGGPVSDIATQANVTFVRREISLSSSGAAARLLTVYLPAGMSVGTAENFKLAFDRFSFQGVSLDPSLQSRYSLIFNRGDLPGMAGESGPIYPALERIPVAFTTNSITWTPSTGRFQFTQNGDLIGHTQQQLIAMGTQVAAGVRGAAIPASNDNYFHFARNVTGAVVFGARAGGIATAQSVTLSLDPTKYGGASAAFLTHFPVMAIGWNLATGSRLVYANGAIDTTQSQLSGALTGFSAYARGVRTTNCEGAAAGSLPAGATYYCVPASRIWKFTRDGGLQAPVTIGSGYNSSTDQPTGSVAPQWSGYKNGGADVFGHEITTGFTSGRVVTAGQSFLGDAAQSVAMAQRPVAMLLTGHSSPVDAVLLERPGSTAYAQGNADYPGLNLRATPGAFSARSRIADVPTATYPLEAGSKYYLRPGGLSGRHLSAATGTIDFTALGANFSLSALKLAFLDGVNTDSGVTGAVKIPAPADFGLRFRRLLLGGQGQLQEASLDLPQAPVLLKYWNFTFEPLALDFPQPKVCPPPAPSTGFVRVAARANLPGMTTRAVVGNLGFASGNLVTEADAVAAGNGRVSRFDPGGLLSVPGPAGKSWNVECSSGIFLSRYVAPGSIEGTLTAAGRMDVPFFQDMEVNLNMASADPPVGVTPLIHVRKPYDDLTAEFYDAGHAGTPAGVTLAEYRNATIAGTPWNPHVVKNWQNTLSFDLPVAFSTSERTFRSYGAVSNDVLLFRLSEAVKKLTPDQAELVFDGQASVGLDSFLPQINVSSLLTGAAIPGLSTGLQNSVGGILASVTNVDSVLADQLQPILKPGLAAVAGGRITPALYNQLAASPTRAADLDALLTPLTTDVSNLFGSGASGLNGQWRRDFLGKISAARVGLQAACDLAGSAANLKSLASGIGSLAGGGGAPAEPEADRLTALRAFFDQSIAQLQAIESALNGGGALASALGGSLNTSSAGQLRIRADIQAALADVKAKWAPADAAQGDAIFAGSSATALTNDLAAALVDRLAGSAFAGEATTLLRQYLGDTQTLTRQCTDELMAFASQLLPGLPSSAPLNALGDLSGPLATASLKGYARINGDALAELRLDGKARLKVPDEMNFDAWFLLRNVDSSTPAGACLAAGGATSEVGMGASGGLDWAGQHFTLSLGGKVALGAGGTPIGLCGDLAFTGDIQLSEVALKELKLGFGFGANNAYLYGQGSGKIYAMDIAAGVFIGRTCDLAVIQNADKDIGKVINQPGLGLGLPITGAVIYGYGGMSLMPIIGIPPSPLLDLRVGGGQGYFAFFDPASNVIAGVKNTQSVTGEILCLATVSGTQDTVISGVGSVAGGSPKLDSVSGTSRFTLSGKVGIGWFSFDFDKSVGLSVKATPFDWSFDF